MNFPEDIIRLITIAMVVIFIIYFPIAILVTPRRPRVWWMIIAVDLFCAGCVIAIVQHIGDERFDWYGTPVILAGDISGMVFLYLQRGFYKEMKHLVQEAEHQDHAV
jgi:hypothetical protein